MADVEVLYKSYGVLADAGENVAQVSLSLRLLASVFE